MKTLTIALAFLMTFSLPVMAQDFGRGDAAYDAGDYITALKEWTPLAEAGDVKAQYNLGEMYALGRGVPQDHDESVKCNRLSTEQGYAMAQNELAIIYDRGLGVIQDYAEAVKWYRLAAAQGNAVAQNNLGVMHELGESVPQDNDYRPKPNTNWDKRVVPFLVRVDLSQVRLVKNPDTTRTQNSLNEKSHPKAACNVLN
jgi:TPR repeat protein